MEWNVPVTATRLPFPFFSDSHSLAESHHFIDKQFIPYQIEFGVVAYSVEV